MTDAKTLTETYIISPALERAVRAAEVLQKPLLIRGEPGTGKTTLASAVAASRKRPLLRWNVKSTTKAQEGLYTYDTVQRLHDSRFSEGDVSDVAKYIRLGALGRAFKSDEPTVVLIDEVDKADIEFPNDLLNELDEMQFHIRETDETVSAKHRPLVFITSNAEKELPDAFLRRCLFHYIDFPDKDQMTAILKAHHPDLGEALMTDCLNRFFSIREDSFLKKKPSTSELIDWVRILRAEGFEGVGQHEKLPHPEALLKREEDHFRIVGK